MGKVKARVLYEEGGQSPRTKGGRGTRSAYNVFNWWSHKNIRPPLRYAAWALNCYITKLQLDSFSYKCVGPSEKSLQYVVKVQL